MGSIEVADLLQRDSSLVVPSVVVAIPVHNERDGIGPCLEALIRQTEMAPGRLGILLFLNNCSDGTADVVAQIREQSLCPIRVVDILHSGSTAGWARRSAMEAAASWLHEGRADDSVLLTTDADSRVPPDWVARNLRYIGEGADAVAGRIALDPADAAALPARLQARGRLEARYEALLIELCARLDPEPGNHWPTHWSKSGATIAVRLSAYESVGGMPAIPSGEDRAFIDALRAGGFRVRHAVDIEVVTSGRLVGRAVGGVADTIRLRCEQPDAPCDDRLEPAFRALARVSYRRYLRVLHARNLIATTWLWAPLAGLSRAEAGTLAILSGFDRLNAAVEQAPRFAFRPVRPAQLPRQIRLAAGLLRLIRAWPSRAADRDDNPPSAPDAGAS